MEQTIQTEQPKTYTISCPACHHRYRQRLTTKELFDLPDACPKCGKLHVLAKRSDGK